MAGGTRTVLLIKSGQACLHYELSIKDSRFGTGFHFTSDVEYELHHLILSTRDGSQLGPEVHNHTHESLVRDLLLGGSSRRRDGRGRRHSEKWVRGNKEVCWKLRVKLGGGGGC